MLLTWDLTVPKATKRSLAISALVLPEARRARTSSSRSLKGSLTRFGAPTPSNPGSKGAETSLGERGPHGSRGGGQLAPLGQCPEKLSLFVLLVQAFGPAVGPVEQGGYDREYYRHDCGAEQDEPP